MDCGQSSLTCDRTTVSGDTTPTQRIVVNGEAADGGRWREVEMLNVEQSVGSGWREVGMVNVEQSVGSGWREVGIKINALNDEREEALASADGGER